MFGNSFQKVQPLQTMQQTNQTPAPSLFSNTSNPSNTMFQQQQQQQQQQPQQQTQQQQQQQEVADTPSRFQKYQLKGTNQTALFQTNNNEGSPSSSNSAIVKKRTIPRVLVKRITKTDNNDDEVDKPSAPILPFKASTQFQADTFETDFAHLYEHNKLPTKSLFDPSIFQDDTVPGEMFLEESVFNKMNENPIIFNNIFQRPERAIQSVNNTTSTPVNDLPWSTSPDITKTSASKSQANESNAIHNKQYAQKLYCSIIVYGFDDNNFSTLVDHFARYGKIMEDLTTSDTNHYYGKLGNLLANDKFVDPNAKDNSNISNFPIFLGNGWLKITYDNPNSAIRALVDNGTDDGNGNILGVMPYRKDVLELLLNQKLTEELNIGDGLRGLNYNLGFDSNFADNDIGNYLSKTLAEAHLNGDEGIQRSAKGTNIKDGSKLILKNIKKEDEKNFWNKGMGLLFGKGEI